MNVVKGSPQAQQYLELLKKNYLVTRSGRLNFSSYYAEYEIRPSIMSPNPLDILNLVTRAYVPGITIAPKNDVFHGKQVLCLGTDSFAVNVPAIKALFRADWIYRRDGNTFFLKTKTDTAVAQKLGFAWNGRQALGTKITYMTDCDSNTRRNFNTSASGLSLVLQGFPEGCSFADIIAFADKHYSTLTPIPQSYPYPDTDPHLQPFIYTHTYSHLYLPTHRHTGPSALTE